MIALQPVSPDVTLGVAGYQPISFLSDGGGNIYVSVNKGVPSLIAPAFAGGPVPGATTFAGFLQANAGFAVSAQPASATRPDFSLPSVVQLNPNEVGLLQGLINSLSAAGGGEIWLSAGTYALTAALTMPATGNISIKGIATRAAVVITAAAGLSAFSWTNAASSLRLERLTITGSTVAAISATALITGVTITDCSITTSGGSASTILAPQAVQWTVRGNTLAPAAGGSGFSQVNTASTTTFANHYLEDNVITVSAGGVGINVTESGATNLLDVNVTSNQIQISGTNSVGINLSNSGGSVMQLVSIVGNSILSADAVSGQIGIAMNAGQGYSITGNTGLNFTNQNGTNCRFIVTTNTTTFGGAGGGSATGNTRSSYSGYTPNANAFDGNTTVAGNT